MSFEISLNHFRAFEHIKGVPIRPITLLTGGNSAGKSSFLAALRILGDINQHGSSGPSFNKDPFFLGSFDQISHHRGGRAGRSKSFSIGYKGPATVFLGPAGRRTIKDSTFTLSYSKRLSQPSLHNVRVVSDSTSIELTFSSDRKSIVMSGHTSDNHFHKTLQLPPYFGSSDIVNSDPLILASLIRSSALDREGDPDSRALLSSSQQLSQIFRSVLSAVPQIYYVGAPVRSRPLRTYNPVDTALQSEGLHVPSQMAQLARTAPDEWSKVRASLVNFGRSSALFSDLEVRSFGRSDSDPFQINIVIGGPTRNIIDVGYGVSQAIPLVFEMLRRPQNTIYMTQQPEVHLHPEAQAALGSFIVEEITRVDGYIIVETHSDYIIDRIRRHVRNGDVSPDNVSLLFFDRGPLSTSIHAMELNKKGEILDPHDGYRDFFINEKLENLGFS